MRRLFFILGLMIPLILSAQDNSEVKRSEFIVTPEIMVGHSAEANDFYPERNPQIQVLVNLGWEHDLNPQEWAQRLKGPRTGLSLGYTNFGNADSLGSSFTILPFIEFNVFRSRRLKILTGMGGSSLLRNSIRLITQTIWE